MTNQTIKNFITDLSSKSPVPGGGGASALIGAVSAALCSMTANLTSGKKKYAEYQTDIENIISKASVSIQKLLELIKKDAEVFEPLSQAYGISKDDPKRDEILENALKIACSVPMEILKETANISSITEELLVKSSKLVISDAGVAASACKCTAESAAMNVFINTKLMKNREYAEQVNKEANAILDETVKICTDVYDGIKQSLEN